VYATTAFAYLAEAGLLVVAGAGQQLLGILVLVFLVASGLWASRQLKRGSVLTVSRGVVDVLTPSLLALIAGFNPMAVHLFVGAYLGAVFLVARPKEAATIGGVGLLGILATMILQPLPSPVHLTETGSQAVEIGMVVIGIVASGSMLTMLGRRMWEIRRRLADAADTQREVAETRRRFISMVSHELRTPLASIQGFAELLVAHEYYSGDEITEFSSFIRQQAAHLARLVDDVLVVLRVDAGQLGVEIKPTPIAEILQRVELSVAVAPPKRLVVDAADLVACTDGDRLYQILRNLVENACKYGGDNVTVTVQRHGARVRLAVMDDGPGIPADQVESAFDEYVQLHERATDDQTGFGLGLPIVKRLTEATAGTIRYVRAEDGDSGFVLEFPTCEPSEEHPLAGTCGADGATSHHPAHAGHHVR
jgi:signal transduction histidine kinase